MDSEIGKRIKQLREKKNMTQGELGYEFGISDKSVSFWENKGVRNKKLLKRISEYFGVSLEYLKEGGTNTDSGINTEISKSSALSRESESFSQDSNKGGNKPAQNLVSLESAQNENEQNKPGPRFFANEDDLYSHIPFIPVTARASFLDNFPDMNFESMSTFPVYNLDARPDFLRNYPKPRLTIGEQSPRPHPEQAQNP